MKKAGTGFVILAALIVAAVFIASTYIVMVLVNTVLGQYNIELLELRTAAAITAFLWIFGGAVRSGNSKD
jgi:hypothetical protein